MFVFVGKMSDDTSKLLKNNVTANKIKPEKIMDMPNFGNFLLNQVKEETIDKLPTELDKQKLNIFKKISSKSKETLENPQQKSKDLASVGNTSSVLGVDEQYRNDNEIKQEDKKSSLQNHIMNNNALRVPEEGVTNMMSPSSDDMCSYGEMSPPRTPGTPKTPEISIPMEQKKKKKDKSGKKKEPKINTPKSNINFKKVMIVTCFVYTINFSLVLVNSNSRYKNR